MKRSVILTDRLGPDILLVLTMKRQVLHRERAHLKVPGCSLVLSALLTKELRTFLSHLNKTKFLYTSHRWFDMCNRKYFDMRLKLVDRIRSLQESSALKSNKSRTGSMKSQNSIRTRASSISRKSKASSSRSLKLEAAVKTAKLKT